LGSIHVPLNENTVHLVDEKAIRTMKKGSIIINTARGKVIDEEALIRALEDGHVSSAYYCGLHQNQGLTLGLSSFDSSMLPVSMCIPTSLK
jgi:hypothetical protein